MNPVSLLPLRIAPIATALGLLLWGGGAAAQDPVPPPPPPQVSVSTIRSVAVEGGESFFSFRVTRDGDLSRPQPVAFVLEGTAERGSDFELEYDPCGLCEKVPVPVTGQEVMIPEGSESVVIGGSAWADALAEDEETVVIRVVERLAADGFPYAVGEPSMARAILRDAGLVPPPAVTIRTVDGRASEADPADIAVFELQRSGPVDGPLTVYLMTQGDARRPQDFELIVEGEFEWCPECDRVPLPPIGGEVTFAAGEARMRIGARAVADDEVEGEESFTVELVVPPVCPGCPMPYVVEGPGVARGVIVDPVAGERPVVTVVAVQAVTTEPSPNVRVIPGRLRFHREGGDVQRPLRVAYRVGGTALNGVDYGYLDGDFTFEAGAREHDLLVTAIADGLPEPRESVVVGLRESDAHRIGTPSGATVWIEDAPGGPLGEVVITAPSAGDVLPPGEPTVIRAVAIDPEGHVPAVEFFVDGRSLGTSQVVFIREPDPGTPIEHEIVWPAPAVGTHRIVAVGHAANGLKIESRPVGVVVSGVEPAGFVVRRLPDRYLPGEPVEVVLVSRPAEGTQAHAVEDQPPAGWRVGGISHEGVFDPATGRVKFGPYFDAAARELRYRLEPPADADARGLFTGMASADGVDSRIGGDQVLLPVRRHPADLDPADDRLAVGELTGYAAAWKQGMEWATGPNPIPASHVTRAAFLWQRGEAYRFDPAAGPAPLWWVPVSDAAEGAVGSDGVPVSEWVDAAGEGAGVDQVRGYLPSGGFGLARWTGGDAAAPRSLEVQVLPVPGTRAHAVEVQVGVGFTPGDVSDGGRYDADSGWLRWGPFLDDRPRRLTGVLAGPTAGDVRGVVSCDGRDRPVVGWRDVAGESSGTGPRIEHVGSRPDGAVELVIHDDDGTRVCDLEVSSDLREWRPVRELPAGATWSLETDTDASTSDVRFYRVRRR